jgi:hypothetical protein
MGIVLFRRPVGRSRKGNREPAMCHSFKREQWASSPPTPLLPWGRRGELEHLALGAISSPLPTGEKARMRGPMDRFGDAIKTRGVSTLIPSPSPSLGMEKGVRHLAVGAVPSPLPTGEKVRMRGPMDRFGKPLGKMSSGHPHPRPLSFLGESEGS